MKADKSKKLNMLVNISAVVILLGTIYSAVTFIIIPVSKFMWKSSVNSATEGYRQCIRFITDDMGTFMQLDMAFYLLLGLSVYLLPTIIAYKRKRQDKRSILLTNIFFGWSVIGWILTLIWCRSSTESR